LEGLQSQAQGPTQAVEVIADRRSDTGGANLMRPLPRRASRRCGGWLAETPTRERL